MNPLLIFPLFIAFLVTFVVLPSWIKRAKKAGLEGADINKYNKPKVAEAGGIVVIFGFLLAVLFYVAIKTFHFQDTENIISIFALTTCILMLAMIGILDDVLGWKIGLGRKLRVVLCLFAAIPLMVINAGSSEISLPFLGAVNLGLIYPLILIPIGIVGASTTFNFLAGYNGEEAGQGILVLLALSIVAYITGSPWLSLIGLCMIFSLLAFWLFNRYPAKVLPGDILTYPVGGLIAIMAILGNFEKIAVFFFIPYIIEFILKSRGKYIPQSFGKPDKDNNLDLAYNKIYSLNHVAILLQKKIRGRATERGVVLIIHLFQIIIILLGFLIFYRGLF